MNADGHSNINKEKKLTNTAINETDFNTNEEDNATDVVNRNIIINNTRLSFDVATTNNKTETVLRID